MNFIADVNKEARVWLKRIGHSKAETTDEPYLMLLRLFHRIPLAQRRTFEMSGIARSRQRKLSVEEKEGLRILKQTVESGDSLYSRLTTQIKKQWNSDMLNDWGIHHFHLGASLKPGGFYGRTTHIALAMVENDQFLLIDILPHGHHYPETWTDQNLLQVVKRTWPKIMDRYRMDGMTNLTPKIDGENRSKMRNIGLNMMVELDGIVYASPGGGVTTDRGSVSVIMQRNSQMRELTRLQRAWLIRYPEKEARLRLMPRTNFLIQANNTEIWVWRDGINQFERLPEYQRDFFESRMNQQNLF